jgi:PAS domain S-box-containing protein
MKKLMDSSMDGKQTIESTRFGQFVFWTTIVAFVFGVVEVLAFILFGDQRIGAASAVTLGYGNCLLVAREFLRRGWMKAAVITSCAGLLVGIVLIAWILHVAIPALTILPLVVVALALPYLQGREIRLLILASWVVGTFVAVLGEVLAPQSDFPAWFSTAFRVSSIVTALGLAFLLLWQFTSHLNDTLAQTRAINIELQNEITERKQTEEKLRQSQDNFAKAFNSNPAAIAITRLADGKFISLNPAYTEIMEYEPHEILDRTAAEMNIYVHPEERKQVVQQLREQGTVQNYELLVRIKSGETRSIVIYMVPMLYNNEECILSVFLDISERKKMEQELQRSNAELEQFAYIASHDLQEPLRAVAGMVQLLGQRYKGKLDERADEYIGHAVEASTRMQNLINDLLDYSRVSRFGKSFDETNLENCLKNALGNLQLAIQESNTQITYDPLPTLKADSTQMTQVLQNLIGNAIKFRGERPLHIHIGAKKLEQAWQFNVSDNGIGIEPQYFERIFLIFQRLHTRREYPGTGIGLSLCKKIIERHGGQIWVESQPEQGSTFYFTIPERAS